VLAFPCTRTVASLFIAGAVVAHVPVRLDLDLGVEPRRPTAWAPFGFTMPPGASGRLARDVVEALVQLAQGRDGEVDDLDAVASRAAAIRPSAAPRRRRRRRGSQARASERREDGDRAPLGAHRHPVVGLGEHAGLQAIGSRSTAKPSIVPTRKV
jgi:hypothetical protein